MAAIGPGNGQFGGDLGVVAVERRGGRAAGRKVSFMISPVILSLCVPCNPAATASGVHITEAEGERGK